MPLNITQENKKNISNLLESLEKKADFFAGHSISKSTKRAYESDWRHFWGFCINMDFRELPASDDTVALYMTWQTDQKISISTIVRRLTSITAIHNACGYDSPAKTDKVSRVLKGIRRTLGEPQSKASPVTWVQVTEMISRCDETMAGVRDSAILALGWCSAMRRSELSALNCGDLQFTENGIIITIKRSKTDQTGHGEHVAIPRSKNICPVSIVEKWLKRRSDKPLNPELPLFIRLGAASRGAWWWESDKRITSRSISEIVKKYASLIDLNPSNYSAHSLRRGFATEAGKRGIPERIIQRHTRHRSLTILREYIESGNIWEENALNVIL